MTSPQNRPVVYGKVKEGRLLTPVALAVIDFRGVRREVKLTRKQLLALARSRPKDAP